MTARRLARARLAPLVLWASATLAAVPHVARAHQIDAVSLTLTETEPGRFTVELQVASATLARQIGAAPAEFPDACRLRGPSLDCGRAGLVGTIRFPWLEGSPTRLMVEIDWLDGARLSRIITASQRSLTVYGGRDGLSALGTVVVDYTRLGVEHILTGFDHLLFVIALTLLVRRRRLLLMTISAFTVAHSLTLASTALGLITVATAPVEATIALSIVLVCAECARVADDAHADSLTRRAPWLVAFAFGLLHGLGFASALMEIGLPERHIPSALLCFNVGVELGQLAVIAAVLIVRMVARRLRLTRPWLSRGTVYAMGATAAFWTLDRVAAVFGR